MERTATSHRFHRWDIGRGRLTGVVFALVLVAGGVAGCGGGGSSDARLRLISFNLENVRGAFLNERLVFTFSAPVAPDSVDIDTVQIRFDASLLDADGDCVPDESNNTDAIVEGDFSVEGNRVVFQPRLPTERDNEVGLFPAHDIASDPRPPDCDRDTLLTLVYRVFLPSPSIDNPKTLVSASDRKPLVGAYSTSFTTVYDPDFPPNIRPGSFVDPVRGPPVFEDLVSPVVGETSVPPDATVTARFSEPFLPSSITDESVFLSTVGPNSGRRVRIAASRRIDPLRREIEFVPTVGLPPGVRIRLEFTEDLVDLRGNSIVLPADGVFPSFETNAAPSEGPFVFRDDFDDPFGTDPEETGAIVSPPEAPGRVVASQGGGTAVLGRLELDPSTPETYVFDTGAIDPENPRPSFDYSSVFVGQLATIRVMGENPFILRSIGDVLFDGTLDAGGETAAPVSPGDAVGSAGGVAGPGGGDGGRGGDAPTRAGGDGLGSWRPVFGDRAPGGGEGSSAPACPMAFEAGGGGGGEHAGGASPGGSDRGVPVGGAAGVTYGSPDLSPFAGTFLGGSGGGGGGATCFGGTAYPGTGGGGGGGAVWFHSLGEIRMRGSIACNGGDGGEALWNRGSAGSASGGGGSGGAILLQGYEGVSNNFQSSLESVRGIGGFVSESGGGGRGGNGGRGRIRVEARTLGDIDIDPLTFNPSPRRGVYDRAGQQSVVTTVWYDTGAYFPDYTFVLGGRGGGPLDQDNANLFPEPDAAVRYLFQGAPTDPDNPFAPDLDALRPGPGRFTENIDEVDDSRFVRVKVVFEHPYPAFPLEPSSSYIEIRYTFAGRVPLRR